MSCSLNRWFLTWALTVISDLVICTGNREIIGIVTGETCGCITCEHFSRAVGRDIARLSVTLHPRHGSSRTSVCLLRISQSLMVTISGFRAVPVDPVSESSLADFVGWGCWGSGGNGSATGICHHWLGGATVKSLCPCGSCCSYCGLRTQIILIWWNVFFNPFTVKHAFNEVPGKDFALL